MTVTPNYASLNEFNYQYFTNAYKLFVSILLLIMLLIIHIVSYSFLKIQKIKTQAHTRTDF